MVVVMHQNSIIFHIKLIGLFIIFRLFILIQLYYVIEEDQNLQELGTKWIGENQVSKFDADFANKRVTIVAIVTIVFIEGNLLTHRLNEIVSFN